jgi:hypothetical protein
MGAHQSCKLYRLTGEYDLDTHAPVYARKPLRVWVDARPALLRYNQRIRMGDAPHAPMMELSGYFVRTGADEYRQLTNAQVERIFQWVALHEVNPLELTTTQVDDILSAPAPLVSASTVTADAPPEEQRTPGGIIIPR